MAITANRNLILLLLVAGAATSYAIGFTIGVWLLVAIGAIFELAFWFKLFIHPRD